jgi:hypothetical protein
LYLSTEDALGEEADAARELGLREWKKDSARALSPGPRTLVLCNIARAVTGAPSAP